MNSRKTRGALALPLLLCSAPAAASAADGDAPLTDIIVVAGRPAAPLTGEADPVSAHATAPDAAALAGQLPGAALVNNGAISGQIQFRGLFGERLAVRVDGQSFQSGGPNAMDPPLHYAPTILLGTVSLSRGAAPVSKGPGMAALVDARLKTVGFGHAAKLAPTVDVAASYRSADDGVAIGGVAGLASERVRFNAIASWEEGNDYRIPDGRARDTGYRRLTYGLSAGLRDSGNTLSLDLRRQETGRSGNPPFAMDIEFFDTDFARLGFDGTIAGAPATIALGYTGVRHAMDNFTLRPPPATAAQYRRTLAGADTFHATGSVQLGALVLGVDGMAVDRTVTIANPNNAAFVIHSLDRVRQQRLGAFAELAGGFAGWRGDIGVRVDRHAARMADPRVGGAVPAMVAMLAQATASGNAARKDTTVDAVARLWREDGVVRPHMTLSRKTRVPNAVERFSWLPTEASGGLADGNIYIGDQRLKPETALAIEAGTDIAAGSLTLRPSVFYRRVDNYIQGTPVPMNMMPQIMIATMNGDATPLVFSNVDAELYGFDGDVSWQALPALRFDATLSWLRGRRRDVADNLYRIAPLNGRASVTWGGSRGSLTGEVVAAARQRKVSATNGESASPGWVTANAWFDLRVSDALRLSGGIENLFGRRYANHLSGLNRVRDSDIAIGERMPAAGRSAFVRIGAAF